MKPVPIDRIYSILSCEVKHWRVPIVDLVKVQTKDPFKVLLATILSARTKDQTTAMASKKLFSLVKNKEDLKKLSQKQIERLIFPVGFYRTKARHLKQLSRALEEKFSGVIPDTVEELCELPGVGRKTANLVVAVGFSKPAVCVDVHVHRITNRLGYVKTRNPFETEMTLREKLPRRYWIHFNSYLVAFGQHLCTPISPHCSICPIKGYCNRIGITSSR
ncbi:MAG: endonuclease III [DPANN group archaeon]|nr:endonuclease III [DPANN group archaeon]